jgi:hypothetical protein
VVLDPNPTAAGSALLLPFHPQGRLQTDALAVDALQASKELLPRVFRL